MGAGAGAVEAKGAVEITVNLRSEELCAAAKYFCAAIDTFLADTGAARIVATHDDLSW